MKKILDLMNIYNIPYNWLTIYVGRYIKKITSAELNEFATNCIISNPNDNNKIIMKLAWEKDNFLLDELLNKLVGDKDHLSQDQWLKELKKFRFVLLKDAYENITNQELLLKRVEEIYSDFDYPEDMDHFINYMPSTDDYDPLKHSKEENIQRLVNFICEFLDKEQLEISFN